MRIRMAALALAAIPGWSHHASVQEFDLAKLILLRGTITKVEWINPHAWLHLEVKAPDGTAAVWQIEGASPNALVQNDFPKDAVTEGMEISITAYPARSGKNVADGATITFQNGTRLFFGGSAPHDGLDKEGNPCIYNVKSTTCSLTRSLAR
jgi:hypothetical protein